MFPPPPPLSPYSLSSSLFSSDSSFFSSASSSSPAPGPAPAALQPWWHPASPCLAHQQQQQPPQPPLLRPFDLFAPVSRSSLGGGGSFECAGAGCGDGNDDDLDSSGLARWIARSMLDDDDNLERKLAEEDAYRRRLELGKKGGSYESRKWCQSQSQRPNQKQRLICHCGYVCGNVNGLIHRAGEAYSPHFPWQNISPRDLLKPKPTITLLRKDNPNLNPNPNPNLNPNPSLSLFHHQICALKKNHIKGWQSQHCPAPAPAPAPAHAHNRIRTDSINNHNHNHPAHNQPRTDSNHNHPAHNQPRTDSNHNHNQFRGACRCCHCDGSSAGMYAVFLKESSSGRDSVGTGVFLPRPQNNTTKRKKTSLSTVLLPSKVVQALNLRLEDTQSHLVSTQHRATESSLDSHEKPLSCSPLQQITADISLPKEWTY